MSEPEQPVIPAACRAALPLFPLPNAQLFPGALLPLHVFEPRYRAMLPWCLEHERAIGIATLRPGYEADYHGAPPVHEVLGVGLVIAAEELDDGRWNCIVRGVERARLVGELTTTQPFRLGTVAPLASRPVDPEHPLVGRLHGLVAQIAEDNPPARNALTLLVANTPDPGELCDVVSHNLVQDVAQRQALLEALDVAARLSLCCDALARLILEADGPPDTLH